MWNAWPIFWPCYEGYWLTKTDLLWVPLGMFPPRIISKGPAPHPSITVKTPHYISLSWKGDQEIIWHLRHYMPYTNSGWEPGVRLSTKHRLWTEEMDTWQFTNSAHCTGAGTHSELPELQVVEMIPEGGHKLTGSTHGSSWAPCTTPPANPPACL